MRAPTSTPLAASVTKEIENEFRSDPEFDEVDSQVADAADTHDPEQEVEAEGEGDEVEGQAVLPRAGAAFLARGCGHESGEGYGGA